MKERASGILMHISSLPSDYGIGDFGIEAYKFIDFLKAAKMRYWQVLPLTLTAYGDSPYQSPSIYAGNPYFVDLNELVELGFLSADKIAEYPLAVDDNMVDYGLLYEHKYQLLRVAYHNAKAEMALKLKRFMTDNYDWLRDFALFMALKRHHNNVSLLEFEAQYKDYNSEAVLEFERLNQDEIYFWVFNQYFFYRQYFRLKSYANENGVKIIGDIPIYCAIDSVEVWSNPKLFKLNADLSQRVVAGVPPDYFAPLGQLWGNPLYDWDYHQANGYDFWLKRIKFNFKLYDTIRIDHFRGFAEYYEILADAKDARNGIWRVGPGLELFSRLKQELADADIIAEDLGFMTDSVIKLVKDTGFANMKVLQFGLNHLEDNEHLPHNYYRNMIAYSGTHDNESLFYHLKGLNSQDYAFSKAYFNFDNQDINFDIIRGLFASSAYLVIIPIQDVLFDESALRMNTPAKAGGNWQYRINKDSLNDSLSTKLSELVTIYFR